MILLISILLWVFCLGLLIRVLYSGLKEYTPGKFEVIIWFCLIILAVPLLFRPHEDIYGGQDPGSYLNSSVSYARNQSLFYQDPLLSEVEVEQRNLFLYGHEGFRKTKDACLWIKDMDKAIVGPWFQPAYPILMSVFPSMGFSLGILYVAPLFTLFTGLVLAALAHQLFRHRWAGYAAFLFYVLNPNTIWHGRCPRPEMIAGFLVFSGIVLLINILHNKSAHKLMDTLLIAVAFTAAPFFHITSLMVILPISIWLFALALAGRPLFVLTITCFIAGLSTFLFQTRNITDCYNILGHIEPYVAYLYMAAGAAIISVVASILRHRKQSDSDISIKAPSITSKRTQFIIMISGSIILSGVIVAAYLEIWKQGATISQIPLFNYMRLTDLKGCVTLTSRPLAALALAGWISMFFYKKPTFIVKCLFLSSIFPALICIGTMPHFMYFSRRIQPFFIPTFAICLTSIVSLIPYKKDHIFKAAFLLLTIIILLLGIRNRTDLYEVTEHKGFVDFLDSFAKEIRKNDGILLCEYSRIAAPFDHYFGIPTLGLDSDRKPNYSKAEIAWERIMLMRPHQDAYFLTPFQPPLSEHFDFTPVMTKSLEYRNLRTFTKLPIPSSKGSQTLSLYKMQIKEKSSKSNQRFPYVRPFGGSNMGFRNLSKGRSRVWKISSIPCTGAKSTTIQLTDKIEPTSAPAELLLFFHIPSESPSKPEITYDENKLSNAIWKDLGAKWWLFQSKIEVANASSLTITSDQDMHLSDIHFVTKDKVIALSQLGSGTTNGVTFDCGMDARWCRADAEVLLPIPANTNSIVLIYGKTSEDGQTLTLSSSESSNIAAYIEPQPEWQWFSFPLSPVDTTIDCAWIKMTIDPPWDPKQERWPNDLGILAGRIMVISAEN